MQSDTFPTKPILLTPGPVQIYESVPHALVRSVTIHHRTPEFCETLAAVHQKLRSILRIPNHYAILFQASSGSGAVEGMIRALARNSHHILVLINGEFGERIQRTCEGCSIPSTPYRVKSGQPISGNTLSSILKADPTIDAVVAVHHETSMGLVNPVEEWQAVCHQNGARLALDMVSSIGGEPVNFSEWHIDFCVSVSGKALCACPGLAFSIVSREFLATLKHSDPNSYYFSPETTSSAFDNHNNLPFTAPVSLVYALHEALSQLEVEGIEKKIERSAKQIKRIEQAIARLGFHHCAVEKPSHTTRTFTYKPQQQDYFDRMKQHCREQGFLLLQNPISQRVSRVFQVSVMGALSESHISAFEQCLLTFERKEIVTKYPCVFFDVDGTLVQPDTMQGFILFMAHHNRLRAAVIWLLSPVLLAFYLNPSSSKFSMSTILWIATVGMSKKNIVRLVRKYANKFTPEHVNKIMFPAAASEIERQKCLGRHPIFVTGSAGPWIRQILNHLASDCQTIVSTQFGFSFGGLVIRERCFGPEKVAQFQKRFGSEAQWAEGYSDSLSDLPFLELCKQPVLINPTSQVLKRVKQNKALASARIHNWAPENVHFSTIIS